jgi:hypothetical protein
MVRVKVPLRKEGGKDRTRNHHGNQHRELRLVDDACLVAEHRTDRSHCQPRAHEQSGVSSFTRKKGFGYRVNAHELVKQAEIPVDSNQK